MRVRNQGDGLRKHFGDDRLALGLGNCGLHCASVSFYGNTVWASDRWPDPGDPWSTRGHCSPWRRQRYARDRIGLQPIVATLALYLGGRGIAQLIVNGELREFRNFGSRFVPTLEFLGLGYVAAIRFQVILKLVIVAIAAWVLRGTTFGRDARATGGNASAARLAGDAVQRVEFLDYCLSGFLAGFAGLNVVAFNRSSHLHKAVEFMELDAIAAVAVGGLPPNSGAGHDCCYPGSGSEDSTTAADADCAQRSGSDNQDGDCERDRCR